MTSRYKKTRDLAVSQIERQIERLDTALNVDNNTLEILLLKSGHKNQFDTLYDGLRSGEQQILKDYLLAVMYGMWFVRLFNVETHTTELLKYYNLELLYNKSVVRRINLREIR